MASKRKMGRPTKRGAAATAVIRFRVTPEERGYFEINAMVMGLSLSEFMLACAEYVATNSKTVGPGLANTKAFKAAAAKSTSPANTFLMGEMSRQALRSQRAQTAGARQRKRSGAGRAASTR